MDQDYGVIEGLRSNLAYELAKKNARRHINRAVEKVSPFVLLALIGFSLWWINMIVALAVLQMRPIIQL